MTTDSHGGVSSSKKKLFALTLAALGVVYGDIGTSPLYAVSQIFFGLGKMATTNFNILGSISLIIWALTIIVAIKYITFVLRADNGGEGGVFALYALLLSKRSNSKYYLFLLFVLTLAAGLLFGDGMITPAISVLSAVEGISVVAGSLSMFVIPLTIFILACLFMLQSKGTAKVGTIFGPIIIVWFVVIAILGLNQIILHPAILMALNPLVAANFITHVSFVKLIVIMGFVMLSITGGEALFADMGHFGKSPIRWGWFSLVYPALVLNYLGQGALLLSHENVANGSIFYGMVPHALLIPMVVLATAATIIASQAMISGAFSLASQASAMKLLPMLKKIHTSKEQEGQIYIPVINWSLFIGCILLVLYFRTSSNLASAYGLAVSGDMLVTSLTMIYITNKIWKWKKWQTYSIFIPLAIIDCFFLFSNSMKFFQGGFIPFTIGIVLYLLMTTWQWGAKSISRVNDAKPKMSVGTFLRLYEQPHATIPKTIIFLSRKFTREPDQKVPIIFQVFWERFKAMPQNIVFLHVTIEKQPVMKHKRFEIVTLRKGSSEGEGNIVSVQVNFGYWENPNVEQILDDLSQHKLINITDDHREWLLYMLKDRVHDAQHNVPFWKDLRIKIFKFLLKNSDHSEQYFGLGHDIGLSSETIPVYLD